jgi:hypothetical protein
MKKQVDAVSLYLACVNHHNTLTDSFFYIESFMI